MIQKVSIALLGLVLYSQTACYYDNGEDLYQFVTPEACDTLSVSYSSFVVPLLNRLCIDCHSGSVPSGNIRLDSYEQVLHSVNTGQFLGALSHNPGFSPMPKGGNKISDCQIQQLSSWIEQGAVNN